MDIDDAQLRVATEAMRRWPNISTMTEGLALAEEAGEVCRAILKRHEGTRGTEEGWSDQLMLELGQVLGVVLTIMYLEGHTASEVFHRAMVNFLLMPEKDPVDGINKNG